MSAPKEPGVIIVKRVLLHFDTSPAGRVIDNLWFKYSSSTADVDRIKHGYDRASNRLWRENTVSKALGTPKYFDELYSYDGLNRLKNMKRGQLSGSPPSSVTNLQFQQDWGLDSTGNWGTFKEDSDGGGSWDIDQARTANEVNEITDITSTPTWADPVYDPNGNMTTMPQSGTPSSTYAAVYDAWNRLVKLSSGGNTVQENAFDGLTRRTIRKIYSPPGTLSETRHFYYSDSWQVLEERVGSGTTLDRQFVWGLRYIDDLVLRDRDLGSPFGIVRHYALQDPNWNVTAVVDTSATVAGRFSYSAYGTPTTLDANFAPASLHLLGWETFFAGYRWDGGTSIYAIRHRTLSPALGTWLTRDPIGYRSGNNLYEYVGSNSVAYGDFTGLNRTLTNKILKEACKTLFGDTKVEKICNEIVTSLKGKSCNQLFAYCQHIGRHKPDFAANTYKVCLTLYDLVCAGVAFCSPSGVFIV